MSELKGQILGVLIVLAVFGAAVTAAQQIMSKVSNKVSGEVESFDPTSVGDTFGDLLTY